MTLAIPISDICLIVGGAFIACGHLRLGGALLSIAGSLMILAQFPVLGA